jgi:tRNA threonylcarbamoyladenosine biosynthesis protein TsaB
MIRPVMPLILAVDTTSEYGSLALVRGGELLEESLLRAPESFSPVLYEELARLLKRHGVTLADVACFAAASGPGTFTGVRVALGCVKGLAEAMQRPAVAVSNLEAVARYGTGRLRGVVLDARRGEIYGAVYDDVGKLITEEVVAKFGPWLETLPDGVEEFLSNDLTVTLEGTRFAGARVVTAPRQLAGVIGLIAGERLARGEASDAAALDANYVRRTDAELALKV